jgi:DNA-binding GntR family transcriptional regulator
MARAYDHVKHRILHSVADGDFITELQVAGELGISRTPVREAFHRLEMEGLLRLIPKKGALIPAISSREITEVMETRQLIELFCAEKVLERGIAIHQQLDDLLAEQVALRDEGDVEGFIDCDRRFHLTIVEAAGNSVLVGIYETLRDRQLRMGVRVMLADPDRSHQVLTEHRAIAKALRAGNIDTVRKAMSGHLGRTLSSLQRDSGA